MRLLVVGGGPAGITGALYARELGAEVTLVEAKRVGGTSINEGPAPVRTLARAARLIRDARSWDRFGVQGAAPEIDIGAALVSASRVADYLHDRQRLAQALVGRGIEVVQGAGAAVFVDSHMVAVPDGRSFGGDAVLVAVGGRPGRLPIPGAELALTYEDVRSLRALPGRVAVIGGADTGCQLASILADFGAEVTLIEAKPRLLARADRDVADQIGRSFGDRSIRVLTSTRVQRLDQMADGISVDLETDGESGRVDVDAVFMAVGWPGNADVLGAADVGIEIERGYIRVDESLRSNVPHVLAAGDVNGISMLVSSARLEGRIAAGNAVLGTRRRFDHALVPTGSFTDPEYGGVGLTEDEARARYDCEVGLVRYEDLMRPVLDARTDGFCKLIVERDRHYILGAHVVGEYAAEVIQTAAALMAANVRIEQVAELEPAVPTFTEAITAAAQTIVRRMGLAPMAPTWGELRIETLV